MSLGEYSLRPMDGSDGWRTKARPIMAKARTGFKLPGFTSWIDRVKNVTAKEAAELIGIEQEDIEIVYCNLKRNRILTKRQLELQTN